MRISVAFRASTLVVVMFSVGGLSCVGGGSDRSWSEQFAPKPSLIEKGALVTSEAEALVRAFRYARGQDIDLSSLPKPSIRYEANPLSERWLLGFDTGNRPGDWFMLEINAVSGEVKYVPGL
jgi:hypothetical protein